MEVLNDACSSRLILLEGHFKIKKNPTNMHLISLIRYFILFRKKISLIGMYCLVLFFFSSKFKENMH